MSSHHIKITCSCTSNIRLRYLHASELSSSEVHPMARKATSVLSSFAHSPGRKTVVPVGQMGQPCSRPMSQSMGEVKSLNKEARKTWHQVGSRDNFFTLRRLEVIYAVAQLWAKGVPSLWLGNAWLLLLHLAETSRSGTKVSKLKHLLPVRFILIWGGSAPAGCMAQKVDTVRKQLFHIRIHTSPLAVGHSRSFPFPRGRQLEVSAAL